MLRRPRVWLFAAGGWLVLAAVIHLVGHVSTYVLERGIQGELAFAVGAMKQAFSTDPLGPSLWRLMRALSVSYALFLLLAGGGDLLLAWIAPPDVMRAWALFGTLFWTAAFVPFAFIDPVLQPIVVSLVAVPLHALAWLTASQART